jgi:hypothetical protein
MRSFAVREILRPANAGAILLAIAMAAGALAGLGLPRLPWQEDPERAAAREQLEWCLSSNASDLSRRLGVGCSQAKVDQLRYEALEK